MKKLSDKEKIKLAKKQYSECIDSSTIQREQAEEDLRIYEGSGIWDDKVKQDRVSNTKGARPCLVINDLPARVRQITNDVRQNKPGIKMRPVDSNADVETAEVIDGIVRRVERQSMSDIAYETANFYQTVAGCGYFRLVQRLSRETNEQELYIDAIPNNASVQMDPLAFDPIGMSARFCFIVEDMPRDAYIAEYGEGEIVAWSEGDGSNSMSDDWVTEDRVRVAEWMYIEELTTNKVVTQAGEMGETEYWKPPKEGEARDPILSTRVDRKLRCMWRKINGVQILKEIELPISYIPVFRVPGEMFIKEGQIVYKGLVRDSRDAVRMVSYSFSAYMESITVQTKTPYIGAAGQFENFEVDWQNSNIDNLAYLQYKPVIKDGKLVPPPQRQPPPMASQGIIQGLVLSQQALKDTSGLGAASLGQKGNEVSGKAIQARQREGDVGAFHYPDNLGKAIRHMGRVLLQWFPKVYDERRVMQIIGEDGEAKTVYLDSKQEKPRREVPVDIGGQEKIRKIYNVCIGCYDVVTTIGPSYSTKRVEATEFMAQVFQAAPGLINLVGDIYFRNQDTPGAQEMAKRLKAALPPQIAAIADDDEEIPPRVLAQMQEMQKQLQEGAEIVEAGQTKIAELETELKDKTTELQIKAKDVETGPQESAIRAIAEVQVARLQTQSNERIAGLTSKVNQLQDTVNVFMEIMNSKQKESTGALPGGKKKKATKTKEK